MPEEPRDTIEACPDRIRIAWDAGDAEAYAKEFAEDATYVIFLAEPLLGRAEIDKNHVLVLAKWQKGTRMAIKIIGARPLGEAAASVLTIGGLGKSGDINYDKLRTFAMVRRDGGWQCAAFQNTQMSRRARRLYNTASAPGILGAWRVRFGRAS